MKKSDASCASELEFDDWPISNEQAEVVTEIVCASIRAPWKLLPQEIQLDDWNVCNGTHVTLNNFSELYRLLKAFAQIDVPNILMDTTIEYFIHKMSGSVIGGTFTSLQHNVTAAIGQLTLEKILNTEQNILDIFQYNSSSKG